MLAEIGGCRERCPTVAALAADAGQAPVAVESGKSKRARFRWARDHRLRNAIGALANTSWCGAIWRLWQDQTAYDPAQHTALQQLLALKG